MKSHIILVIGFALVLVFGWALRLLCLEPQIILHGAFIPIEKPVKTFGKIYNGNFQLEEQAYFTVNFPLRNTYIKLHNQFVYSIFRQSPNKDIVLGINNNLFQEVYIIDYFHANGNLYQSIEPTVQDLKYVQEELLKRGKKVAVIITPSKADFNEANIPEKYKLLKSDKKRNYEIMLDYFNKYDIRYFDSNKYLKSIETESRIPFFQRTGVHWNYVAASYAAENFCKFMNDLYGAGQFSNIKTDGYDILNIPLEQDVDIYNLMNTVHRISDNNYKNESYYKPKISENFIPGLRPTKIFVQGGSFQNQLVYALNQDPKNKISRIENTFVSLHDGKNYNIKSISDFDINQIIDSDVFIFEVNVRNSYEMGFGFVQYFKEYLQTHKEENNEQIECVLDVENDVLPSISYGFYDDEGLFRWSQKSCGVEIENNNIIQNGLQIEFSCMRDMLIKANNSEKPNINIYINGKIIKQDYDLINGNQKIVIPPDQIPKIMDNKYYIEIECNETFCPKEINLNTDERNLGLQIYYIGDIR